MDFDASILQAIRLLYDAVLEPDLWSQTFAMIGRVTAGDHVIFFTEDLDARRIRYATGVGVGPKFFQRLADATEANILPPELLAMPAASVRLRDSLWPRDAFDASPFYNEVVRPDGGYDGLLAVPFRANRHSTFLAIERLRGAPDFENADAAKLQTVLPHLSNALRIRLRLEQAQLKERHAFAAFDLLDFGVMIVDAEARPIFLNKYAEKIVRQADGLSVSRGRLQTASCEETRALHRAVKSAAEIADMRPRMQANPDEVSPVAARLSCSRPSLAQAFIAMVMPVNCARADSLATPQGCAILFVTQPGEPPRLDTEAVAQAFGLTPRQAMLAVLLARGASLAQAAAALKVTVETARWHLKEIFERTNTHRQADLVRLLCKAFESSFKS